MPPNLQGSNKFQEMPSGASRMQENLLAPDPTLGEFTTLPQTL